MRGLLIVGKDGEKRLAMLEKKLRKDLGAKECLSQEGLFCHCRQNQPKTLVFQKGGRKRRLSAEQILYLEKRLRKVEAVLEGGKTISFYSGMKEVMEQLDEHFCQCHKSYAVNLKKVETLEKEGFRMTGGTVVPISQRKRKESRWRYEEFQEEKNLEKLRFFETFSCLEI